MPKMGEVVTIECIIKTKDYNPKAGEDIKCQHCDKQIYQINLQSKHMEVVK